MRRGRPSDGRGSSGGLRQASRSYQAASPALGPRRCHGCGFLSRPDLLGCPDCPQIHYCSQVCQARDRERHRARHHPPQAERWSAPPPVELPPPVSYPPTLHGHLYPTHALIPVLAGPPWLMSPPPNVIGSSMPPPGPPLVYPHPPVNGGPQLAPPQLFSAQLPHLVGHYAEETYHLLGHGRDGCPVLQPLSQPPPTHLPRTLAPSPRIEAQPVPPTVLPVTPIASPRLAPSPEHSPDEEFLDVPPAYPIPVQAEGVAPRSRAEMKREIRRAKKATRRREKMAAWKVPPPSTSTAATPSEARAIVDAVAIEATEPEASGSAETESVEALRTEEIRSESEVISGVDDPVRSEETPTANPRLWRASLEAPTPEVRVLTKREKKREERRIQNAVKKMAKKEQKASQTSEAYEREKAQALRLCQVGSPLECAVELTKVMRMSGPDAELLAQRRDCYVALDKIHKAWEDAQSVVELAPNPASCLKFFTLCLQTGQVQHALDVRAQIPDEMLDRTELDILALLEKAFRDANELMNEGQWSKALRVLVQCQAICPQSWVYHLLRCECLIHFEALTEAKSLWSKIAPHWDQMSQLRYLQALHDHFGTQSWKMDEHYHRIHGILSECVQAGPAHPRVQATLENLETMRNLYQRAQEEQAKEDPSLAKTLLQSALSVEPTHKMFMSEIHYMLSTFQTSVDDKIKDLHFSLRFKESQAAFMDRGKLLKQKRQFNLAIEDFESVLKLDPHCRASRSYIEQCQRSLNANQRYDPGGARSRNNDYYAELEVSSSASTEEITKAYHAKVQALRSAMGGNLSPDELKEYEMKVKTLSNAANVLTNPRRREFYDKMRKRCNSSDVDSDYSEDELASDGEEMRPGSAMGASEGAGTPLSYSNYVKLVMDVMKNRAKK